MNYIFCTLLTDETDVNIINKNINYLQFISSSYPLYVLVDKNNPQLINICKINQYKYLLLDLTIQPWELNFLTYIQFDLICFINSKILIANNLDFIFNLYNKNNSFFVFFKTINSLNKNISFLDTLFFEDYIINKNIFLCKPNLKQFEIYKYFFELKKYSNISIYKTIIKNSKDLIDLKNYNCLLNLNKIINFQNINPRYFPFFSWLLNEATTKEYFYILNNYSNLIYSWINNLENYVLESVLNNEQ